MYLPHHLRFLVDHLKRYDRRQQLLIIGFRIVAIGTGTYLLGVELLIAIGAILLLDLVTVPIHRLFGLR